MKMTEGGMISGLLWDVRIPRMLHARQAFPREVIPREEIAGVVDRQLSQERFTSLIKPGMGIAVTAGSRGIRNMDIIIKAIVGFAKGRGAVPFIVPAIGSHGGAATEGQLEVLASYDITPETMGCPIRSSMEVVELGASERGGRVFINRSAHGADGIIVSCRLRPHNAFRGAYGGEPCEMMTVGLDEQEGASIVHSDGIDVVAESIPTIARVVLERAEILLAIPCMENAYDETCRIEAILAQNIMEQEPRLLKYAFSNMPKFTMGETNVLVVGEIGKNCSGTGVDPDIIGTFSTPHATGRIRIQRTCFLNLGQASHGSALGCGLASAITKRIFDQMNIEKMYPNCITSTVLASVWTPRMAATDREVLQLYIHTCNKIDRGRVRVVRIVGSLHIGEIMLSEAYYEGVKKRLYPGVEALDESKALEFDESGSLTTPAEHMAVP